MMMNAQKKEFIWIDWISLTAFLGYVILTYTSSERFNVLLGRASLFTSIILIILFFNHIDIIQRFKDKEKELLLCLLIALLAVINMFFSKSGPGVLFDIANFTFILYLSDKIKLDNISSGIVFISFLLILLYWIKGNSEGYNYNTISLIVFESAMLSALTLSSVLSKWKKDWIIYPYLTMWIITLVLPFAKKYQGRTELGALLIFLFFFLFIPKFVWQIKHLYAIFLGIIAALCMIIPAVFTRLYYNYLEQGLEIPSKLRVLHGREPVWMQFYTAWKKEPWTGIGNDFIAKIPDLRFSSTHNGFLHLLVVYGILIFIIILMLFAYKITKINTETLSLTKKFGLCLIITMFAISAMESYIITPFSNMFLFFTFLIVFKEDRNQIE